MHRSVQGAAWVAALAALWAYALTLSPTVAWVNLGEDSGDLLAASATLGIAHPTGYPLFVLIGRLASVLPLGSIAFRINLVAAAAGAAGVYFLARFVLEVGPSAGSGLGAALAATGAALIYGFSRGVWSQSVLAEVYTLNIAFLGAILWSLARAERKGELRYLLLAGYLFGLGLTNHLLLLAAGPAVLWVAARWTLSGKIGLPGIVLLPILCLLGLTVDIYLPIRASRIPEFSWGAPATPAQLAWVLTGAQYARNFFARSWTDAARHLLPGRWGGDFGLALAPILAGLAALAVWRPGRTGAAWVALVFSLGLLSVYAIGDDVGYWMPAAYLVCALAGVGWSALWETVRWRTLSRGAAILLLAGAALFAFRRNYAEVDASKDLAPYLYAQHNIAAVEPNALIVSEYDGRTFALWFYKATDFKKTHPDLVVAYKYLLVWPWYLHHLARYYHSLSVPGYPGDLDLMMNRLIARNIRKRPVYLTRQDPGLAPLFTTEPVGDPKLPLYRVREATR